jgi:hypothetical protein
MEDMTALLHNMSAPSKSVVKYSGLADLAADKSPSGAGACGVFGTPVRFALPADLAGKSAADILRHLGADAEPEPERKLAALIDARASELPLPDGCAVIPALEGHRIIWADALSALAILAKCSDTIWLRAKSTSFNAALVRRQATLLVPPRFADPLKEKLQ